MATVGGVEVSITMPAYNEEDNIEKTVRECMERSERSKFRGSHRHQRRKPGWNVGHLAEVGRGIRQPSINRS